MTDAPFHAAAADGPPGGRAVWLNASDGVRLRAAVWPSGQGAGGGDKGTVILLTGRTEYIEKYGRAAGDLAARGWTTVSFDWRGQGLSDRALPDPMKGHVGSFAEYQRDLDAVLAWVTGQGLPRPLMLMAHSMGACLGLRGVLRGLPFRAAVFSAPMWGIRMAAWQKPVAALVTACAGPLGLRESYTFGTSGVSYVATTPFQGNTLTSDPGMWDYMKAQLAAEPGFALGGPTTGWLKEALAECRALMAAPAPGLPAITALGTREQVVDAGAVHARMAGWANGQLDLYPGAEHEIMMETPATRARFFDRASALFDANR